MVTFPNICKMARVIPVHKGEESVSDNYIPDSLLPVLFKILDRIVNMQVRKYLKTNSVFFAKQYGVRKKHSTEIALG